VNIRTLKAFLRRDFREAVSYKYAFFSSLAGIFFSSATFYFIARLVGGDVPELAAYGGDYFAFAVIGVAFSGLLGIFQEGLPSVIRTAQISGTLEAVLVSRASVPTILLGSSLYSLSFQVVRTFVFLAVASLVFGLELQNADWAGITAVFLLTSVCFFSLGLLAAGFILVYKKGNPLGWIFGTVSGLFGGVVFPVAVLPGWLRWISSLLPITYALDGFRLSLLRSAGPTHLIRELSALAVFDVLLLPAGLYVFKLALRKAKKDGTLTHF